jgi:hypothetical protein
MVNINSYEITKIALHSQCEILNLMTEKKKLLKNNQCL